MSGQPNNAGDCPRLIEVALPIREISAESVRDKSLRHGHISTLHLWWARRPLAASRAVVFASLVPDPDDPRCPSDFRAAVERHLKTHVPAELKHYRRGRESRRDEDPYRPYDGMPDTPRNRLLMFIAKWSPESLAFEAGKAKKEPEPKYLLDDRSLVKWETSDPENAQGHEVLRIARELVKVAHGGEVPTVLDPFAGGGAIPLEAGRLGCQAIANDYNPVAYLILRATCEFPQKYGRPGKRKVVREEFGRKVEREEDVRNVLAQDVEQWAISYQKGVYYAENGDFSSAGAADIQYFNTLPTGIAKFMGGSFNYYRGLFASSVKVGDGNFLYALEGNYNDGPWEHGNHYKKGNAVLRYSQGYDDSGWSLTFMGYKADWNATDQIAKRAVDASLIDRFGSLDPPDGGNSQRYSLSGEWHRQSDTSATQVMAYGFYYDLDLFSNFTYFLANPIRGDQFEQPDRRWVSGLKASHTLFYRIGKAESESTVGLQVRNDNIHNGLFLTQAQQRYATVREDDIWESSISLYADNKTRWNDWLRGSVGVRFDGFRFDVDSNRPENSGTRTDGLISAKGSIVLGPWVKTEIYLNGGLGFHSNDARGVNTRVDPVTGKSVQPADPLVRTYGAEVGARTTWVEGLQSTLALWWLDIDSELVFLGDAGTTGAGRPSRRYGIEFANYYSPTEWLTFDADFSFSKSRFRDNTIDPGTGLPVGRFIPGSVETVIAAGATVHDLHGFFGGLRLRYFGPRALIEGNSVRSNPTALLSANLGYEFDKTWTIQAEVFNLLNRKDSAIDYFYTSRLPDEPAEGMNDIHFHPIEPINFRIGLRAKF